MKLAPTAPALIVGLALVAPMARAQTKIDLRTADGVAQVKGQWRYADAKIIEVENTGPPPKREKIKTYNIEPHAEKPDFDDGSWEAVEPATLKDRRGTGLVCFGWYRLRLTLPEGVEGKSARFVTTVDDYGEVWIDGQLPRKEGQRGGNVVAGFNAPNEVELKDPKPGKTYHIAIFAINGPISAAPGNYLFLRETYLEISK